MRPGDASRPFVDRPVGDLGAATRAAGLAADEWELTRPELVRVGMNALYAADGVVLRVGAPTVNAEVSMALSETLRGAGLAVPRPARDSVVAVDGLQVTCWHRIEPIAGPIAWRQVGRMVAVLHALDPASLPQDVPLPSPATFPWWDFDAMLDRVAGHLDDAALGGLAAAIDRHRDWRRLPGPVVCHGDVHPGNVMMSADGPVLLDWDLLCWASPGWDHAPMMTWAERWGGDGGDYEEFAAGYGRSMRDDPTAEACAELRLVAATLMRVAAAAADPAASAEAERRLRYWRGDPAAPAWTAQ
jgi:Ser/Thr protein kinase RdoA (MazF antagonist)